MIYQDSAYPAGVRFLIEAEQDDTPVRGNAMASGDDAVDREVEDDILAKLASTVWAWCVVRVVCRYDFGGSTFEGDDYLGACSYEDEAAFVKPGDYWDDMKAAAYEAMRAAMVDAIANGEVAQKALRNIPTLDALMSKVRP